LVSDPFGSSLLPLVGDEEHPMQLNKASNTNIL